MEEIMKKNRIATVVHYLMNQPEELLSVFFGRSCLLYVDDLEKKAILNVLLKQPKLM